MTNTSFIFFQLRTFILSKTRNLMPYNIRPETFSIVHIFGSPLSFPMPLAISHFFLTYIYRLAIFGSLSKGVFEQRASTGGVLLVVW